MSFSIYITGCLIFIGGLVYGAVLLNVSYQWIAVAAIIMIGFAVLTGVKVTRQKDPVK